MTDQLSAAPQERQERRVGVDRRAQVPKSKAPAVAVCGALLLLFGWNVTQQIQISHMGAADQADRQELAIKGVNEHLTLLADKVANVSEKQKDVMLRTDFAVAQQDLANQLEGLKSKLAGTQQTGGESPDFLALKAQIESVQTALEAMDKRVSVLAQRPVTASAAQPAKFRPKTPAVVAQRPVKLSPPFQVIGLEVRGGERFLSVAPNGSTRLDQISLIRPGDTRYDWHLRNLGSTTAEFEVNGTTQVLTLQ
ncbi:hypothetical protein ALP05_04380 [Pseudomonas caricapapayae]|uniref:Uncharacterized protein n=1 Tax=Pseudomonas caricapapayae TaxID=46678 RepID=A0A3M6FEQ3_9PSED|nr:hypothetical protein [Pseudomonas caricapapayae]RMV79102.1 hypothetical protein ALP05_04380 [Pseudomonas caricapapayae]